LSVVPAFGLALTGPGCGAGGPAESTSPSAANVEPLRIAAATDLQRVLPVLIEAYKASDPAVVPTFGSSGQLAEQIRKGAPFDVFLSANMKFPEDLEREGVVAKDSVRPYARGTLVLAVYPSASGLVGGLADLEKPEVRKVAIANPRFAPYGAAASQALERAGLSRSLEPKLVLAESVRQAFLYVEQGDAEAALVSRSLTQDGGALKVIEVDPGLYDPLIQGLGLVVRSDKPDRARRFVEFVMGEGGRSVLGEHGFRPAGGPEAASTAREGGPDGR
jgi:molybdate transport system substrate-binding protein